MAAKEVWGVDPDDVLDHLRELAKRVRYEPGAESDATTMAGLFVALDEWLSRGGFLPDDWRRRASGRQPIP